MAFFNKAYLQTLSGILKIIEIVSVILAFCILLGADIPFADRHTNTFAVGALVMGMVITTLLLICYLMGDTEIQKTIMEPALNFILFLFLCIVGSIGTRLWSNQWARLEHDGDVRYAGYFEKKMGLAMSGFTIMAALAYGVDAVLALMKYTSLLRKSKNSLSTVSLVDSLGQ